MSLARLGNARFKGTIPLEFLEDEMYIFSKRHKKANRTRCSRNNAKLKAKNRRRKVRMSGLKH